MKEIIHKIYITGYQSYEMGIFNEKDPRVKVIKNVLKNHLITLLEDGLEWVMVSGALGVETWGAQVAFELQQDYPELKVAVIFPFQDFGKQWKEANQLILADLTGRADFFDAVSHKPYENPQQFRNHTQFLLSHTDASLVVYEDEFPGKTRFFIASCEKYQAQNDYQLLKITLDDLENSLEFGDSV